MPYELGRELSIFIWRSGLILKDKRFRTQKLCLKTDLRKINNICMCAQVITTSSLAVLPY
jgi:hypothetical protein